MSDPLILRALLDNGWQHLAFEPFRDGIEAHWIARTPPQVAILRYAPGASAPLHRHEGLEMIVVLDGSQSDAHGTYRKGDVVLNPAGSQHRVASADGCVVLLHWTRPVAFLE